MKLCSVIVLRITMVILAHIAGCIADTFLAGKKFNQKAKDSLIIEYAMHMRAGADWPPATKDIAQRA